VSRRIGRRTFASRKRKVAGLLAFVLAGVLGLGAYAFTASNTIQNEIAGVGNNTLTSYEVTGNDSYTIEPTGLETTKTVFVIKGALEPTDVEAALSTSSGPTTAAEWADCKAGIGTEVATGEWEITCDIKDNFKTGTQLWVAAVSEGEVKIA
jgi:hypothetical protein